MKYQKYLEMELDIARGKPDMTKFKNIEYTEKAVLKIAIPSSFKRYVRGILKTAPKILEIAFATIRITVLTIKL